MSIASRQVKKAMDRIIEERMKEGYIPTIEYIFAELGKFYQMVRVGFPSFKARKQLYRKVWDIIKYNDNLSEIYDDLHNLYEELVDQFTVVLKDFDYYDTERRKLLYQIKDASGNLMDLLLAAEDTEGYLYSVHDDFIDRSKINMRYTTCEINTDAGMCTLRDSRHGIEKVDMSHYYNAINYPVLTERKYADRIISNKLLPGSRLGYAFSDIHTSWIQNIRTNVPGELNLFFIIELFPHDEVGQFVSRIEFLGHSPKPIYIEPLWSLDNINFRRLPMGDATFEKSVSDDKKTVWNFSDTRIRYIKFMIRKEIEDQEVTLDHGFEYEYIIGAKSIEIFKMAYDRSSVLYSNAFTITDPTGESVTIDKAALLVDQDIQAGTNIRYFLSLGTTGVDDPTQYQWVSVSPLNIEVPEEQQVVDFRHVAFFNNIPDIIWDSSSYGTPLEIKNGIPFYRVYEFPYEPLRDSTRLYRGKNNWKVSVQYRIERKIVYDEKHSFGTGNTIKLENPSFTPVEGEGMIRGSVVVKSDPGQNPTTTYINPSDYTVNYSTFEISRHTGSNIVSDPLAPSNTVYVDYQYDNEVAEPTIYTTYIYVSNPDGIDVNIRPFTGAQIDAGQFLKIETIEGMRDLSSETFFHIPPGWRKIETTARPQSADDRFYLVNNSKYLHQLVYGMYAFAEPMQEVSWFELQYNTMKSDRSRYCIIDYDGDGDKEIVVNFRPQTALWSSAEDDLLCSGGTPETFVLTYKYISTITDKIYFKAIFSRDEDEAISAMYTPTLRSYTIKLGY